MHPLLVAVSEVTAPSGTDLGYAAVALVAAVTFLKVYGARLFSAVATTLWRNRDEILRQTVVTRTDGKEVERTTEASGPHAISSLHPDVEALKVKVDEQEEQVGTLVKTVKVILERLDSVEDENVKLHRATTDHLERIKELEGELAAAKKALASTRRELQMTRKIAEDERARLQTRIEELEGELSALRHTV